MNIYNLTSTAIEELNHEMPWYNKADQYFIVCHAGEVKELQRIFHFDEGTIEECINIDENIRFDSFEDYDFISLDYLHLDTNGLILEEINLYISIQYVLLVTDEENHILQHIHQYVLQKLRMSNDPGDRLNKIYYWIFDQLLTRLFLTIEALEDRLQSLEGIIIENAQKEQFKKINHVREQVNMAKKHLRPLLYIGDQFIVNENNFIQSENLRYFKNIDIRINKLYGFISDLKEMGDQLLYLYDSSLTAQTNEVITRLTVLTTFFGPLTIITGIYGMNFEYMPELRWLYGYPGTLLFMLLLTLFLYIIFKKKNWI